MKVYLAKFYLNDKVMYKIGHTKYYNSISRFESDDYDSFDKIEILEDIYIEHRDAVTARHMSKLVEACLQAYFPKDFRLEEHFGTEPNFFDGMSGITECFILNNTTEVELLDIFRRVKREVGYIVNEHREHKWQY